ncbi:type II toxin-antitoxin system RelE/ParE family toxin [Staphylococcus gallinarum]|uniref:type II toxin-antitoxin system RelE/ParE family toxin n=1 Tax=Staphylococcus gallinarum TaxID=1293 RepID=UPI001E4821C0|nr:type II toxin-antitoxin system RelE/ParE family toxin [Staphylococcus gallinarum]
MANVIFNTLEDENKNSEFINFVNNLPQKDKMKLLLTIQKIQDYGIRQAIKMEWVKKLEDGIYEIRSKLGNNHQRALYFQKIGNEYIITHGFTKKTNKTPPREILRSKKIIDRYKRGELNELNF